MSTSPESFELIVVPYDSGKHEWRMGRGPMHLLPALEEFLDERRVPHKTTRIRASGETHGEIAITFELWEAVSRAVSEARARGHFPVVLSGNCGATVGAVAGLGVEDTAVVWFDAHGDFNTPETTRSGFLDGMCAAVLAGRCWAGLAAKVSGFRPLDARRLVLCGTRDIERAEARSLRGAGVRCFDPRELREAGLAACAARIASDLESPDVRLYLHLDMDVHDPEDVPANGYQPPGGLNAAEVRSMMIDLTARLPLAGLSIAAFDPDLDPRQRGRGAVRELARALWAASE